VFEVVQVTRHDIVDLGSTDSKRGENSIPVFIGRRSGNYFGIISKNYELLLFLHGIMEEQKSDVMTSSRLGEWIARFYGQDTSLTGRGVSEKFDRELKCNVGPLDEDNGDIQKDMETTGRTVGKRPVNAEDSKNVMRPVVQMIPANNSMRSQHNIMPDSKSQIERLSGCKYFSLCDFSNFYFQIAVDEQYTRDVGLISSHGVFEVHRLIQGEKNSSFTASKLGKALRIRHDIVLTSHTVICGDHLDHGTHHILAVFCINRSLPHCPSSSFHIFLYITIIFI
jgi:hypothetical protein